MKKIILKISTLAFLISTAFLALGCVIAQELSNPPNRGSDYTQVHSFVTSYPDQNVVQSTQKPALKFITATIDQVRFKSLANELVSKCTLAAEALGYEVIPSNKECKDCLKVLASPLFNIKNEKGIRLTGCADFFGSNFGTASCYTYQDTEDFNRWLGLTFYNAKTKTVVNQIDVYSDGPTSTNEVATEMCFAALEDFPAKLNETKKSVNLGLKKEIHIAPQ